MRAQPRARTASLEVADAHEDPCVDRSVMQEQLQATDMIPPVPAPVVVAVSAPLVIGQAPTVIANHRVPGDYYLRPTAGPPLLRSAILRI